MPSPEINLTFLLTEMGRAGQRLAEIDASEGAAGNISVFVNLELDPGKLFPHESQIELPLAVPELAGTTLIASGSGCRLREIHCDPSAALGLLLVEPGGQTARLFSGEHPAYQRITSEFNSHLAVHRDQFVRTGRPFQAILHAQPLHLTYLSQLPRYRNALFLSRRLLRWQPELILNLPKGLAVVPFIVPGTLELMQASVEALRSHSLIIWSKHGVMARSADGVLKGCDWIEYVETAARYELLNLQHGEAAGGLTAAELREIAATYQVEQDLF